MPGGTWRVRAAARSSPEARERCHHHDDEQGDERAPASIRPRRRVQLAGDKLIVLDEDGVLALTTPTPTGLTVHARVQLLDKVA